MTIYNPQPTPENSVVFGRARFILLTDRLVRMEWAEDGVFEDRLTLAVVHRALPPVSFTREVTGSTLRFSTAGFTLTYKDDGQPFSAENLAVTFTMLDNWITWSPGLQDTENLGATLRTLDGIKGGMRRAIEQNAQGEWVETDKWVPVDLGNGFVSRRGWALVDDSANVVMEGDPGWVTPRAAGMRQDWYLLVHGHDFAGALADAMQVFGRQPLPPRFAFGYWWSRYWAYSDKEIEHLVEQFNGRDLPIDVMVVDMDWHLEGWTGYTWDRRYFPDPQDFLRYLKEEDLKITLNLHPADGVGRHEEQFTAMAEAMGLDPEKIDHVPFDITDPRYMENYFRILHHPQERDGVDFWWMDWQQGSSTKMPGLDKLPWINHLHWRDMERNPERRGKRPLIFSRFGGYGAGRYCIGFSGDTISVWDSLKYQPYFTSTAANVLYGYWSHDIGGHMPGPIEPELYTRWVQFGVYSPVLRTHTSKHPTAERRFWAYPDPYNEIMMDAVRQRYEMVPYIYSEARKCYDTGISLNRPMYYAYPETDMAYESPDQYLFGDSMLVAPILEPAEEESEMASGRVWLPEGRWFDTARGCYEDGNQVIQRKYLISEVPVFVRPGAIIPGQKAVTRLREGAYPHPVVTAFPGGDGAYRLYEDDGISLEYEQMRCAWIPLSHQDLGDSRLITVGAAEGDYQGFTPTRSLEIRLPGTVPPAEVRVADTVLPWAYRLGEYGWTYDGQNATTIIRMPEIDLTQGVTMTVVKDPATPDELADGLKGLMARLVRVNYYNTIATSFLILHTEERLGVDLAQVGNRITRTPSTFTAEVTRMRNLLPRLETMLHELGASSHQRETAPPPERMQYCQKATAILGHAREELAHIL